MSYPVTTLSAAILGLLLVILSVQVIRARSTSKVSLGDGGDEGLIRRMRGQANFSEYAPMGLILMFLAEAAGSNHVALITCAGIFVLGRLMHGITFGFLEYWMIGRFGGTLLTFIGLVLLALLNLWALV